VTLRSSRLRIIFIFCAWAALLLAAYSPAQQLAKRLILKDGSYQLVTKWEVHGDRVRYYSAERDDWEELPNAMVDWDATNKYEKEREAGATSPEAVELKKEFDEARKAEEANAPEVAPGLKLEDSHAAYLLDTFQTQPQLVQLQVSGGTVERSMKKSIFHGDIAGPPNEISLKGAHAEIQAHAPVPSLYVNAVGGPQDTDQSSAAQPAGLPWDRFRIVSMDAKEDKRIVGRIKVSAMGKSTQQQNVIKTNDEQLTGGWVKVTPVDPLPPGEYALVELLGDEGMNLYVWDFGVNPQAPANKNAEQAAPPAPLKAPALKQR
jgi:hypothetical protein